ncbi:restriction endonuclease [Deinococcus sp. PESE-13]
MANKNTEYELFVKGMSEILLRAEGLKNISVQHDILLRGVSGQDHQIDVYWEFSLGGIRHRVALECKNYSKALNIGKVRDFHSVLRDVPHLEGAMVTRVGFQSGAVRYAEAHGIGLKIIRPIETDDWEGRVRAFQLNINIVQPIIEQVTVHVDRQWVESHAPHRASEEVNQIINQGRDTLLLYGDPPVQTQETLAGKLNKFFRLLPVLDLADENTYQHVFEMKDYWLPIEGLPPLRLAGVEIRYHKQETAGPEAYSESAAKNIIKDVLTGQLLFVDDDGRLSGDIEVEGE